MVEGKRRTMRKRIRVWVWLYDDDVATYDAIAKQEGVTRSAVIADSLENDFPRLKERMKKRKGKTRGKSEGK